MRPSLSQAMDELAKAFSIVTGTSCRACVKMIEISEDIDIKKIKTEDIKVKTFCRTTGVKTGEDLHPIAYNTDFSELFNRPDKRWFFGNDLPKLQQTQDYKNSADGWKERYRSTIVWPIRDYDPQNTESPQLLGFLCVDSRSLTPFSEDFDYPLGAMVADVLRKYLLQVANVKVASPTPQDVVSEGRDTVLALPEAKEVQIIKAIESKDVASPTRNRPRPK